MYGREIDGRVLTLAASGWTYNNVFVLADLETRTLWYPYPERRGLLAIDGPLEGRVLEASSAEYAAWSEWRANHPETLYVPIPPR